MDKEALLQQLYQSILDTEPDAAAKAAQDVADNGVDVMEAIRIATKAVTEIGDQFQSGEVYLPSLMLAGEAMKRSMALLTKHLSAEQAAARKGKVVVAAVEGDIHDIGKNLVATMLSVHGYDTIDLGVNVKPMDIVERAMREKADFIALSSLMTTSMPYQRDVIEMLQEMGARDRIFVLVGGGPVTPEYARSIGADGYGLTAVSAVRVCDRLSEDGNKPPVQHIIVQE